MQGRKRKSKKQNQHRNSNSKALTSRNLLKRIIQHLKKSVVYSFLSLILLNVHKAACLQEILPSKSQIIKTLLKYFLNIMFYDPKLVLNIFGEHFELPFVFLRFLFVTLSFLVIWYIIIPLLGTFFFNSLSLTLSFALLLRQKQTLHMLIFQLD